jgi:hypothetical protein
MHGPSIEEAGIYAICWMVAFFASLSRSARDADAISIVRVLGLGSSSGFFAIGTVGLVWGDLSDTSPMYLLGVSAFIGLVSKEQDQYVKAMFSRVSRLFTDKSEQ